MSLPTSKNGPNNGPGGAALRALCEHPVEQAWTEYARVMRLPVLAGRPKVAGSTAYSEAALAYFAGATAVQEVFLAALEEMTGKDITAAIQLFETAAHEAGHDPGKDGPSQGAVLRAVQDELSQWVVRIFDPEAERRKRIWWGPGEGKKKP
jgi:hypothetical protein